MNKLNIVLLCADTPARAAYLKKLAELGVHPDIVENFGELRSVAATKKYSGIIIDLVTGMRAPKSDKQFVYKIIEKFPVVQLKWDESKDEIRTLYYGQSKSQGTICDFIKNECCEFEARAIRAHSRKKIFFSVILCRNDPSAISDKKELVKTITYDISLTGVFIYSTESWNIGEPVWIIVKELRDHSPIKAVVKRFVVWGKFMEIPGIGVKVEEIEDGQKKEIENFLEAHQG